MQYDNHKLTRDLPPEFSAFMDHLKGLQFADRPDYQYLYNLLDRMLQRIGGSDPNTLYDWEETEQSDRTDSTDRSAKQRLTEYSFFVDTPRSVSASNVIYSPGPESMSPQVLRNI